MCPTSPTASWMTAARATLVTVACGAAAATAAVTSLAPSLASCRRVLKRLPRCAGSRSTQLDEGMACRWHHASY
ncbi:hypothetical protein T492DRAFT_1052547 [Pavlovales sp. CCMP2436]|nr:hypothetical protein T492DRAFT_1052547 [Pavlovales sp. CCMP2436]